MATGRVPTTANSPLTAKGDLFGYSTTQARVAVGNDGETLVADSSTSTGLRWQGDYAAGKNKVINGDFGIWQRGTSFTTPGTTAQYNADRWLALGDAANSTITQQTFTPGTAPVAGYEGQYYLRYVKGGTTANQMFLIQRAEDVRTFAGQTITLSYWMKASTTITNEPLVNQNFGSGGSGEVYTTFSTHSVTTSWTRYSVTMTVPSVSGKTIGSSSYLGFWPIRYVGTSNVTVEIWGVQAEVGSVATAFQTATGTIQGELAACQRYYLQFVSGNDQSVGTGGQTSSTDVFTYIKFPVNMRTAPTSASTSGTDYYRFWRNGSGDSFNSWTILRPTTSGALMYNNTEISGAANNFGYFDCTNSSSSIAFSAEL